MDSIKLIKAGISVYEVEISLGKYSSLSTADIRGFTSRLLRMFPGLRKHECCACEAGGFVRELRKGTDLAHVIEHLTIEMLKNVSNPRRKLSGWTRKKSKNYVLHFQVPDSATGKCAASCAIRVIEAIIEERPVSRRAIMKELKEAKGVRS
jgi:cyanophycin synthetase